jgi:hypothetical protein
MKQVIFKNRMAMFVWGFSLVWLIMLTMFTWLLVRDGPPDGYSGELMWAVVGLFWVGGAGLTGFALSKACYQVSVAPKGGVTFTWQYPHRRIRKTYERSQLTKPIVVEDRDSDGDPYFYTRLELPDGSLADLAEGHDQHSCELASDRFEKAIAQTHE